MKEDYKMTKDNQAQESQADDDVNPKVIKRTEDDSSAKDQIEMKSFSFLPVIKQIESSKESLGNQYSIMEKNPNNYALTLRENVKESLKAVGQVIPGIIKIEEAFKEIQGYILNPVKDAIKSANRLNIILGIGSLIFGASGVGFGIYSMLFYQGNLKHEVSQKQYFVKGNFSETLANYFGPTHSVENVLLDYRTKLNEIVNKNKQDIPRLKNRLVQLFDDLKLTLDTLQPSNEQLNEGLLLAFNIELLKLIGHDIEPKNSLLLKNIKKYSSSRINEGQLTEALWIKAEV